MYGYGEATGNIRLTLAFDPRQAILVAGSTEPPRPDRVMVELLEAAGFDVVFVDDDSDLAGLDLTGVDLLAISSSVKPPAVDGVFADSPVPVLVWEGFLFDELGLASVGRQSACPQTDVIVVGGDHPAAAVPGCTAGCTSCRRPWSPMAPK